MIIGEGNGLSFSGGSFFLPVKNLKGCVFRNKAWI